MAAPAGFYPNPDPDEPGLERYWDGSRWTQQTRPAASPATDPLPATESPSAGSQTSPILNARGINGSTQAENVKPRPTGIVIRAIIVLLFAGMVVTMIGLWFMKQSSPDLVQPVAVNATVVEFRAQTTVPSGKNRSTGISCFLVVEFRAQDGQVWRVPTSYGSSDLCGYSLGQEVQIEYDATDPTRFSGLGSTFGPLIFTALGVLIFALGVAVIVARVRSRIAGS